MQLKAAPQAMPAPTAVPRRQHGVGFKTSGRNGLRVTIGRSQVEGTSKRALPPKRNVIARFQPNLLDDSVSVRVPLEPQQLLGLKGGEVPSEHDVRVAYDELARAPVESGYSDLTVLGRLEVLDLVRGQVLAAKPKASARGDGRMLAPGSFDITLPSDTLPGALALMTEVGQSQLALALGQGLLDTVPPPEPALPVTHTSATRSSRASPAAESENDGYSLPANALWRDVHMTLALAQCAIASDCLHASSTQAADSATAVSTAVRCLLEASALLRHAGEPPLAPGLASQIQAGLRALQFQEALEVIAGPVFVTAPASNAGTHPEAMGTSSAFAPVHAMQARVPEPRKKALRTVRDALKAATVAVQSQAAVGAAAAAATRLRSSANSTSSGTNRGGVARQAQRLASQQLTSVGPDSIERLMACLSVEEVVNLMEWETIASDPAAYTWLYPGLLEAVVVAHVVHGFTSRQPAYIQMALALMQRMPTTQQTQPDLKVVAAVGHLLLGDESSALQRLKEAAAMPDASSIQSSSGTVQNGKAATTLHGGIRMGGSGSSSSTAQQRAKAALHSEGAVSVLRIDSNSLPAGRDAYRFVCAVAQDSGSMASNEADLQDFNPASSNNASDVGLSDGGESEEGLLQGVCTLAERWLQQAAFPFFRDTAASPPSSSLPAYFDNTRVEALLTVYQQKQGSAFAATLTRSLGNISQALSVMRKSALPIGLGGGDGATAEGWMAQLLQGVRPEVKRGLLAAGFVVTAVGVGLFTPPGQRMMGWDASSRAAAVVSRAAAVHSISTPIGTSLDAASAHALVHAWETVRAAALGPRRARIHLAGVVAEPLLQQTLDTVTTLEANDCYAVPTIRGLTVTAVRPKHAASKKPGVQQVVEIQVAKHEMVNMHTGSGKVLDQLSVQYRIRYTACQNKEGVWQLTDATEEGTAQAR